MNENRSLIHTGKLLRPPDSNLEWGGWTELFALLFDNYRGCFSRAGFGPDLMTIRVVVMTKPKERDGVTKYQVYRRVRQTPSSVCNSELISTTADPTRPSHARKLQRASHTTQCRPPPAKARPWRRETRPEFTKSCRRVFEPRDRDRLARGLSMHDSPHWAAWWAVDRVR